MTLEKKSGLFYEVLIRGEHGAEPGRALGEFAGAHYIEGEAVVDSETGEVVQYKAGLAQDLPADKVASYLGDRFVAFEAQHRALQTQIADAEAAASEAATAASAAIAERDAQIAARDKEIDRLSAAQADAAARVAAALAALDGRSAP